MPRVANLAAGATALLILAALAGAAATILYVIKDWLVGLGVRWGIAAYNARLNSRPNIQEAAFDLLSATATVRGISVTEPGQPPQAVPARQLFPFSRGRQWCRMERSISPRSTSL
jgi:hypothetical protein